jgi:hypothetical protein
LRDAAYAVGSLAEVLVRCSILLGGKAGQVDVTVGPERCQRGVTQQRLAGSAVGAQVAWDR